MAGHRHLNAGRDRGKLWVAASDPRLQLQTMVRDLIVPRLLGAHVNELANDRCRRTRTRLKRHQNVIPIGMEGVPAPISEEDVARFKAALLSNDLNGARQIADGMLNRGVPVNEVLRDLFGAVALELGDMWVVADCSFVDVTLALGVLQVLMRDVVARTPCAETGSNGLAIRLFAVMPEQHTLGNLIIGEVFRSAGWFVSADQPTDMDQACHDVASNWFDVIGLSVACDRHLDCLTRTANGLRHVSVNPDVLVIGGGRALIEASPRALDRLNLDRVLRDPSTADAFARSLAEEVAAHTMRAPVLRSVDAAPPEQRHSIRQPGSQVAAPEA